MRIARGVRAAGMAAAAVAVGALSLIPAASAMLDGRSGKPLEPASPPRSVALVISRTERARYIVVRETSQSGPIKYVIDNVQQSAVTWIAGKVSLIQLGARVYASEPGARGCFESALRRGGLLPNIAGMLLPSGTVGFRYGIRGSAIDWSIAVAKGYQPHGSVSVDMAGQIADATVFSGPGRPLNAVVSYPRVVARVRAPSNLCTK